MVFHLSDRPPILTSLFFFTSTSRIRYLLFVSMVMMMTPPVILGESPPFRRSRKGIGWVGKHDMCEHF